MITEAHKKLFRQMAKEMAKTYKEGFEQVMDYDRNDTREFKEDLIMDWEDNGYVLMDEISMYLDNQIKKNLNK